MQSTFLSPNSLIKGIFLKEIKNRFLCEVEIQGKLVVCYIPSSCRLSNFVNLYGCEILLNRVLSKNARTQFAVFAIKYKRNYILLNTSLANLIIESSINQRRFSFLGKRNFVKREKTIEGYKCDLFIEDNNIIIEVKSIISLSKVAAFPSVFSQRAIDQLKKLLILLDKGYLVYYCFVSLNPYVDQISISRITLYYQLFQKCLSKGMKCFGVSIQIKNDTIGIKRNISVNI